MHDLCIICRIQSGRTSAERPLCALRLGTLVGWAALETLTTLQPLGLFCKETASSGCHVRGSRDGCFGPVVAPSTFKLGHLEKCVLMKDPDPGDAAASAPASDRAPPVLNTDGCIRARPDCLSISVSIAAICLLNSLRHSGSLRLSYAPGHGFIASLLSLL
jgi:hypothetical protein